MRLLHLTVLGCTLMSTAAMAADRGPMAIDPEVMEKIRTCAADKGIDLPEPPQNKDMRSAPPPRPSESERKIIDACFRENGLNPPQPPGGGHRG